MLMLGNRRADKSLVVVLRVPFGEPARRRGTDDSQRENDVRRELMSWQWEQSQVRRK